MEKGSDMRRPQRPCQVALTGVGTGKGKGARGRAAMPSMEPVWGAGRTAEGAGGGEAAWRVYSDGRGRGSAGGAGFVSRSRYCSFAAVLAGSVGRGAGGFGAKV